MTDSTIDITVRQTLDIPMQSVNEVKDHANALSKLVRWSGLGILYDDGPAAVLILQLNKDEVVGVCRFCLSPKDSAIVLQAYVLDDTEIEVRCCQGLTLTRDDITSLAVLTEFWKNSQTSRVSQQDIVGFFERVEQGARNHGRDGNIKAETRRQVWFDAHGRCMFEGCGKDLTLDPTTGQRGNFAYLAHNVAASETGPRGMMYLSGLLANVPSNILLLCDVHHRLIDTVSKADYPAERLSDMRSRFCEDADKLLESLSKPKIPAFCVSWPVHRQVISVPSLTQVAEALLPIGARLDGQLRRLNDNEKILRDMDPENIWLLMPDAINAVTADILAQLHTESYSAALFAMGLMPALIALGAMLGNKNAITPMLLHRESGLWYWPNAEPQGEFFVVSGFVGLPAKCEEISMEVAFTARPDSMRTTAIALGHPIVTIQANENSTGNGALGHPLDGRLFRQRIQELLHRLYDEHGVRRVHLMPCASNAACVFLGQAYDSYHPEVVIYDFCDNGKDMVKRLMLSNKQNRCIVSVC